jgi:restriction system protein
MPIPTYDQFIEPILRYLAQHPDGAAAREVHDAAADSLNLSAEERALLVPSGAQAVYKNRAGWAHDRLKRAGYSSCPQRGFWQLTPDGAAFAQGHPAPLAADILVRLATDLKGIKLGAKTVADHEIEPAVDTAIISPEERLDSALREMRQSVAAELLESLSLVTPKFFEGIVLDLLHRMGYGASREDLQRVGGVGDGGIDGIISLDRLGLEKVYVQAKRWQGTISRPEIQGFYGALAGQKAKKGVFITTSVFTQQAIDFARSVEGIVLVDGNRLAELMIDHEVGVTLRPVRVPRLDGDYFDE